MRLPDATEESLVTSRELLREARALLDNGEVLRAGARAGVLGLYETLGKALDAIDPARVRVLLGRIAEQVEALSVLAAEVDRLRGLRKSIRAS